jgi:hypothetical protein
MAGKARQAFRVIGERGEVPAGGEAHDECRCACGSLLGRIVPEGIELKCRRCKRTFVLPIEEEAR